ncbi:MAG TPA: chemotaxis protein CheC [Bacillota bacterium]|nr:chemotaxis protein CheC [Bacillota bacterium]
MKMFRFGEMQFDVLKEVGNIGAGNAATALSKLISKEIDMLVPLVKIVGFDDIAEFVGGAENVVVSVYLRIIGDVPGNMFFIMSIESAKSLIKQMMGIEPSEHGFSEMEISALSEIGNILIGSYLTSLADFTNLNMQPSVPSLAIDMAGAILSFGLIEMGQLGDYALAIDTVFLEDKELVEGHFFLLPDPESLEKVFSALGVPVE